MKHIKLLFVCASMVGTAAPFGLNGFGQKVRDLEKELISEAKKIGARKDLSDKQNIEQALKLSYEYNQKYTTVRQEQVGGAKVEAALVLTGLAASVLETYALTSKDATIHKVAAGAGGVGAVADAVSHYPRTGLTSPVALYNVLWRAKERYNRFNLAEHLGTAIENMSSEERKALTKAQKQFYTYIVAEGLGRGAIELDGMIVQLAGSLMATIAGALRHYKMHRQYNTLVEKAEDVRDGVVTQNDQNDENDNDDQDEE